MLGFNLAVGFSIGNFPLFCPRAQILMCAPVVPLTFFRQIPAMQAHVAVFAVGVFAIMRLHVSSHILKITPVPANQPDMPLVNIRSRQSSLY
jgi:hypothetical protein